MFDARSRAARPARRQPLQWAIIANTVAEDDAFLARMLPIPVVLIGRHSNALGADLPEKIGQQAAVLPDGRPNLAVFMPGC
jgi:hypothetical protein